MCDPVSIGLAVLSAVSAGVEVNAANKAAKAQAHAINDQLASLQEESRVTEAHDTNDQLRAMRKEQARTRVAAGEAGLQLGSGSIETLLKDSLMQASHATNTTALNAERDRKAASAEATSQLSQVQKTTALGAGLKVGIAGAKGYMSGQSISIQRNANATNAGRKA